MTQEQLRMQMLAGIITEGEYQVKLSEEKIISQGQKVEYAKGNQPSKIAYMKEYSNHPYNPKFCVVAHDKDLKDTFLIPKSWIKSK
jgi:hypothetical protein